MTKGGATSEQQQLRAGGSGDKEQRDAVMSLLDLLTSKTQNETLEEKFERYNTLLALKIRLKDDEIQKLRAENEELRARNAVLENGDAGNKDD